MYEYVLGHNIEIVHKINQKWQSIQKYFIELDAVQKKNQ